MLGRLQNLHPRQKAEFARSLRGRKCIQAKVQKLHSGNRYNDHSKTGFFIDIINDANIFKRGKTMRLLPGDKIIIAQDAWLNDCRPVVIATKGSRRNN
jgi:hypothetical protein